MERVRSSKPKKEAVSVVTKNNSNKKMLVMKGKVKARPMSR